MKVSRVLCSGVLTLPFIVEAAQTENVEENEEPFVAPPGLNVPSDVELVCVYILRSLHFCQFSRHHSVILIFLH